VPLNPRILAFSSPYTRNPSDDLEFKQVHNAGPLLPRAVVATTATTGILLERGWASIQG
jgi:hypothetical protein